MYNDNYRLAELSADKVSASGVLLDASFQTRLLTQTTEIAIVPKITSSYLPDDSEDQSTNGYLDLNVVHKTLKSAYGGIVQLADETVILSELLPADFPGVGLGQIVGENGRVTIHNRRKMARVAPTYTYDLSPLEHLHLDAEYYSAAFERNLYEQIGFKNYSGKAGIGFDLSQRTTVTTSLVGAHFEPDQGTGTTNSYGFESQLDYHRSDITRYYVRLGAVRSQADVASGTVNSIGVTGGAGVSWTYQITQYVFDALRGVTPTSSGSLENHTEVRFRVLHAFRPLLSGFAAVRAVSVRGALGGGLDVQGSDYLTGSAGFTYELTRSYRLAGEYDYTLQKFQFEPKATSNSVGLSIIYQPWSRFEPLPDFNGLPVGRPQ